MRRSLTEVEGSMRFTQNMVAGTYLMPVRARVYDHEGKAVNSNHCE